MINITILALALSLSPYHGPILNGSIPGTAKFMVDVSGRSGQSVRLRALGVPRGYIASFCTNLVCAPFSVTFPLPKSGREQIELQFIENTIGARKPASVTVGANGTVRASIAFARASH